VQDFCSALGVDKVNNRECFIPIVGFAPLQACVSSKSTLGSSTPTTNVRLGNYFTII
jgi:hypothetical protein